MVEPTTSREVWSDRKTKLHTGNSHEAEENLENNINYTLSAAYVKDAVHGRFYKSGLGRNILRGRRYSLCCFYLHTSSIYLAIFILVTTFHTLLAFAEPTQMIFSTPPPLQLWVTVSGCICTCVYSIDLALALAYRSKKNFISFIHCKLYVFLILLVSADYILYFSSGRMVFRLFRPSLLLFRIRALRGIGLVILGVIPKFLKFLLLMGAYIAIFSAIGVHIFMEYYDNDHLLHHKESERLNFGSFNNVGIATLKVFVVMTGGSYPLIMFPAYERVKTISVVYYVIIIVTGQLVLYGILVARIFEIYVEANKEYVKKERFQERQCLIKAFQTLDMTNAGYITYPLWKGLMIALRPKACSSEIRKRFQKLKHLSNNHLNSENDQEERKITLVEFFHLLSVLQFTVEVKSEKSDTNVRRKLPIEKWFLLYWKKIQSISKAWSVSEIGYWFAVVVNLLFLVAFSFVWYTLAPLSSRVIYGVELILLLFILLDVSLRLLAVGLKTEVILHFVLGIVALACLLTVRLLNRGDELIISKGWPTITAHLAIMIRLTGFRRSSTSLFHWLRRMTPPLATLICVVAISFYTYAIVGIECFGYLAEDKSREALPRGISLCRYGFESLGCSFFTLFQISLGSSWHKVMNYIMDQVSPWTSIYFVLFYAMMQMVVLNVISAVMVELSNVIYSEETEASSEERKKGDSTPLRNATPSSYRSSTLSGRGRGIPSLSSALSAANRVALLRGASRPHSSKQSHDVRDTVNTPSPCPSRNYRKAETRKTSIREVNLSGRKAPGNWTRDITPDMTFLNAEEFRRLQAMMGLSTSKD